MAGGWAVALALAALGATACSRGAPDALDANLSLYALVSTIDGTALLPPLGPELGAATGTFDAALLPRLQVVLEREDSSGNATTLDTFGAATEPRLVLLADHDLYWMNVPAAAYFTDPSKSYRFRVLLDGREIGRSDMDTAKVFDVLRYVPNLPIGVKLRIEDRPAPSIAALSPSRAVEGSSLALTVTGAGFVRDSVVRFAGVELPTTWVSSTELTAELSSARIAMIGTYGVSVFTAAPGGGTSASADLEVVAACGNGVIEAGETCDGNCPTSCSDGDACTRDVLSGAACTSACAFERITTCADGDGCCPAGCTANDDGDCTPIISALSPAAATAGGAALTITLDGPTFASRAAVRFGATLLQTTLTSSTRLTALVPAALLELAGSYDVRVEDPAVGNSAPRAFLVSNPAPSASTLAPSTVTAGLATTLTVTGAGFTRQSVITLGGAALATTFVSGSQLTASVSAAAIATAGTANVAVTSPSPGGGASAGLTLTVNNPTPALATLTPGTVVAGAAAFTLTIDGSSFVSGAVVTFNGTALATVFVSATRLLGAVPATLVATAGSYGVTAANPLPSAGSSAALTFVVGAPLGAQTNPGASCDAILAAGASRGNGVYYVTAGGQSAFAVYCDMTGGGWTLVGKVGESAAPSSDFTTDVGIASLTSPVPSGSEYAHFNLGRFDAWGNTWTVRTAVDTANNQSYFQYAFFRPTTSLTPSGVGRNWNGTTIYTQLVFLTETSNRGLSNTTWLSVPACSGGHCGAAVNLFTHRLPGGYANDCLTTGGQTQVCHAVQGGISGQGPGTMTAAFGMQDAVGHTWGRKGTVWIRNTNRAGTP